MSNLPFDYEPAQQVLIPSVRDEEFKLQKSNLGTASTKELAQNGLELAFQRQVCIPDARRFRRLLAKLIPDDQTEFQAEFSIHLGLHNLANTRKGWLADWRRAGPTPAGFIYQFVLHYPVKSDPFAASVAAGNFAYKFSCPEYGGINKFILVHKAALGRPVSHLIVNRLVSGRFLVQSDFSMGHLKHLHLETAREAGAVL